MPVAYRRRPLQLRRTSISSDQWFDGCRMKVIRRCQQQELHADQSNQFAIIYYSCVRLIVHLRMAAVARLERKPSRPKQAEAEFRWEQQQTAGYPPSRPRDSVSRAFIIQPIDHNHQSSLTFASHCVVLIMHSCTTSSRSPTQHRHHVSCCSPSVTETRPYRKSLCNPSVLTSITRM